MKITMDELAKQDFEKFLIKYFHKTNPSYCIPNDTDAILWFYELPFYFQSGVYKVYLREKGIYAKVDSIAFKQFHGFVISEIRTGQCGDWTKDHNTAEIAALNEGFKIREQQLKALVNA